MKSSHIDMNIPTNNQLCVYKHHSNKIIQNVHVMLTKIPPKAEITTTLLKADIFHLTIYLFPV